MANRLTLHCFLVIHCSCRVCNFELNSILELLCSLQLEVLKDKSGVGIIHATKVIYHLLTRFLTFVSHFEYSDGCHCQKRFYNSGYTLTLCRHFLVAHNKEVGNDLESKKGQPRFRLRDMTSFRSDCLTDYVISQEDGEK